MARKETASILMRLPLETRYTIFEYLSTSKTKPKNLLSYWFEKTDVKRRIAEHMLSNPGGPTPTAVYPHYDYGPESWCSLEEADGEEKQSDGDNERENGNTENISPCPVVQPQTKWRFIPNFMGLTHCPPPTELLLTCRQLHNEAKDWYYGMAALRVNATRGFVHTDFLERALGQMAGTALSPLEHIRKAEVIFVWDSILKATDGLMYAEFPDLLGQQVTHISQGLMKMPNLHMLVIYWHPSFQGSSRAHLRDCLLGPFETLSATVKIEEHYIAPDAPPGERSVAEKRRLEP